MSKLRRWLRSSTASSAVAIALSVSQGMPAAVAAIHQDTLRPGATRGRTEAGSVLRQLEQELGIQAPSSAAQSSESGWVTRREIDPVTGAYQHLNRFTSAANLLTKLFPYIDLYVAADGQTHLRVKENQKAALRPLFSDLAYDAVIQTDPNVRDSARWVIRELAPQFGVRTASAHDYYHAMGEGKINSRTWPAFNIRWDGHNMVRDIFKAAKAENAGAFILEIAASEETYTGKGHDYAGMAAEALAAAVVEGYEGPVFLKMDHTQINAKNYWKDPAVEMKAMKTKITRGLMAGFMNVDLDTSTIEYEPEYVELKVTEWVVNALRSGALNDVVASEDERSRILSDLTYKAGDKEEIRFNNTVVNDVLGRVYAASPDLLAKRFGWKEGVAEKSLADLRTTESRETLQYEWDRLQQSESAKTYIELADHARKEAKRIHETEGIGLGAEVGEVGKKFNTTLSQVRAFLDLVNEGLSQRGVEGPNVFSVQTGSAHGGQFDAQGNLIRNVDVDWNLLKAVSAMIRTEKYGYIAGSEQHGFSTVAEARLSDLPAHDAAEVHLATEYANILLYGISFGEPFMAGNKIYIHKDTQLTDAVKEKLVKGAIGDSPADEAAREELLGKIEVVEVEPPKTELQQAILSALQPLVIDAGIWGADAPLTLADLAELRKKKGFKDIIKKVSHNQGVLELFWNLPPSLSEPLSDARQTKFRATFQRTNTSGSFELAKQYASYAEEGKVGQILHPAPLELARIIEATEATFKPDTPSQPINHPGKVNVTAIAATVVAKGLRGSGDKTKADTVADAISDAIIADQGIRNKVAAFEGELDVQLGDLEGDAYHLPGAIINPKGLGPTVAAIDDVIEGTSATASNNKGVPRAKIAGNQSGGTSIRATGPGVEALGVIPDMYGDLVVTRVLPARRAEVQKFLSELQLDAVNPYDGLKRGLEKIAQANGITVNDIEIVVMERPREQARLAALRKIQDEYSGLVITTITDGTVAPGVLAALGRKQGKHLVEWTVGKTAEGFYNLVVARTQQANGAVAAFEIYSPEVNKTVGGKDATDLSRRYDFTDAMKRRLRGGRKSDAEAIIAGNRSRVMTPDDVAAAVEASMILITDNGWFGLPGTMQHADGTLRMVTLRFSDTSGTGHGRAWVEVDDTNQVDIDRMVARGTFAIQEPAAADPSVVDPDGKLLALMKNGKPQTIVAHESLIHQSPGLLIAWERALDRFRADQGLKTLDDAAKASAVKLALYEEPVSLKTTADTAIAEVTLAAQAAEAPSLADKAMQVARQVEAETGEHVALTTEQSDGRLVVRFMQGDAAKAAKQYAQDPDVAQRIQAALDAGKRSAQVSVAVNQASQGATQLTPNLFTVVSTTPKENVALATGPSAFLASVPETAAKVTYEPAAQPTALRSPAAALVGGVEAVVAKSEGREPDPDLLARLDVLEKDGTLVAEETNVAKDVQAQVVSYQAAVIKE